MKKKIIILTFMIMGGLVFSIGCGNSKSEKQEIVKKETTKSNKDKEDRKKVEYEYGITNLKNVNYVPAPLKVIGEEGNPLEISEDYLGYYSNGYIGYDIRQINGYQLRFDVIEFGYRTGSGYIEVIEENGGGLKCSFYSSLEEKTEFLLTTDGFSINNTDQLLQESSLAQEDSTYCIVQEVGRNVNGISNFLRYELGEYKKTDAPKNIYNLTFNGAENVHPEAKREKGMPSWEEYDKVLQEKLDRVKGMNMQPIKNRRDHDRYPKYIKCIPASKYYVNADKLQDDKIILMEVLTGEEATYEEPYTSPNVNEGKAGTFDSTYAITEEERNQEEANQYWENGGSSSERLNNEYNIKVRCITYYKKEGVYKQGLVGINDKKTFTLASLNYDVPELVGMLVDDGKLLCGEDAGKGYKYFNLDCTDVEKGKVTIKSNMLTFQENEPGAQNFVEMTDSNDVLIMQEINEEELREKGINLEKQ